MKNIFDFGGLTLGSCLKRVSDALFAEVDAIYRSQGMQLSSRCCPILFLLDANGPTSVSSLAGMLGQTHSAVSQMNRKLVAEGLIERQVDPGDERRRMLSLSPRGKQLVARMRPLWSDIRSAMEDITHEIGHDMIALLRDLDAYRHAANSLTARVEQRHSLRGQQSVEICEFEDRYAADFKRLNVEWLEKYFYVEEVDHEVLSDPRQCILEPGGEIFFARLADKIVGTVALIPDGENRMELSKMAVTQGFKGLRIGKRLLQFAIDRFKQRPERVLFLESNSRLTPAINLYKSSGFVLKPRPSGSHYQRADVYMEFQGGPDGNAEKPS